jgi:hypothetical protein
VPKADRLSVRSLVSPVAGIGIQLGVLWDESALNAVDPCDPLEIYSGGMPVQFWALTITEGCFRFTVSRPFNLSG